LEEQILDLCFSPHWILIVNVNNLRDAAKAVLGQFSEMPMDFRLNEKLKETLDSMSSRARKNREQNE